MIYACILYKMSIHVWIMYLICLEYSYVTYLECVRLPRIVNKFPRARLTRTNKLTLVFCAYSFSFTYVIYRLLGIADLHVCRIANENIRIA